MSRTQELLDLAANKGRSALDYSSAKLDDAAHQITPLLDQAATRVAPYVEQARDAATIASRRAASYAADRLTDLQPAISAGLEKVPPAVDRAQRALQDTVMPRILEALRAAAATPAGAEAREILADLGERTGASVAALETELAKTKKTSTAKTVVTIAAVGAVIGALAVAVKTFLGSKDDWAAYESDEPYVYPDDDPEIETVIDAEEVTPAPVEEPPAETQPYGDGSYAGPTPPEGYVIKGNARSMKYHVPESTGYARTRGDVWFNAEAAAEAAGFVKSQR